MFQSNFRDIILSGLITCSTHKVSTKTSNIRNQEKGFQKMSFQSPYLDHPMVKLTVWCGWWFGIRIGVPPQEHSIPFIYKGIQSESGIQTTNRPKTTRTYHWLSLRFVENDFKPLRGWPKNKMLKFLLAGGIWRTTRPSSQLEIVIWP